MNFDKPLFNPATQMHSKSDKPETKTPTSAPVSRPARHASASRKNNKGISLLLPPDLYARLKVNAEQEGRKINPQIVWIIRQYLSNHP